MIEMILHGYRPHQITGFAGIQFTSWPFHLTLQPMGLVIGTLTGWPGSLFGQTAVKVIDGHFAGLPHRVVNATTGVD